MKERSERASAPVGLIRQLGFFDSTMVMVGIVIGSGIFLTTGIMANSIRKRFKINGRPREERRS